MAEASAKLDFVMQDLQNHLRNANLEAQTISSIARKGDEKVKNLYFFIGCIVLQGVT